MKSRKTNQNKRDYYVYKHADGSSVTLNPGKTVSLKWIFITFIVWMTVKSIITTALSVQTVQMKKK